MKFIKRLMVATAAAVALAFSGLSYGQALSQVPGNCLVVLHVKDLQNVSQKVAALVKETDLPQLQMPMTNDLLGYIIDRHHMQQGLNKSGDLAVALFMPTPGVGPASSGPNLLVLVPVSDYQAFLSNYPDAKTQGAVSTFTLPTANAVPVFAAKWGDYAAISTDQNVVSGQPGGLVLSSAAAKEIDADDACLLVNMPTVRNILVPMMIGARPMIMMEISQAVQRAGYANRDELIKVAANTILDEVQKVIEQCDDVTVGVNLSPAGINSSFVMDFKPGSHFGQLIASEKDTDRSLLQGLPDGKYLFLGGSVFDPKVDSELVSELTDPLAPEIAKLGADGQDFADYIKLFKDYMATTTGKTFGMVVPEGELGTSPLFQFISVADGDSKTIAEAARKATELGIKWQSRILAAGVVNNPMKTTFTPAAKTLDGVQFDQYHTGMDMTAVQSPRMAKVAEFATFAYGQDGLSAYFGAVNDTTFLEVGGLSDDKISAAIAAAKSGNDSLGQQAGIQDTAAHLPKQRIAAYYLPVDTMANTILSYVAKFGLQMGVTMAPSDPIGWTISTDGSAVRGDLYVPVQIVKNAADVANKLMMHRMEPGGTPPAMPPGGTVPPPPPAGGANGGGL
jgi:hypothetical protein